MEAKWRRIFSFLVLLFQVDAHNVVPVWETSDKQEYAARTIRNKVTSKLDKFLTDFPPVVKHDIKPTSGVVPVKISFCLLFKLPIQAYFLDIRKKTQAQKTQNSSKIQKKTQAKSPINSKTGNWT